MIIKLEKIRRQDLRGHARQQEAYNFQELSGILADYGFMTIRLCDDFAFE